MKRLIICCDGTWNTPNQSKEGTECPTNVAKMKRALLPRAPDGTNQILYYGRGVGTRTGLDRWTGGALGHGLDLNVEDAYRFLMHNYEAGDDLYFFGFSRGAYTARSVVGFLRNSGLLRKECADQFTKAYEMYRSHEIHPDDDEMKAFRAEYSHEVRVQFLGVWDTVGALGVPLRTLNWITRHRYQFHDVRLSSIVDHAYHALAIDEKRRPFRAAMWDCDPERTSVEQRWFAGVHSDVGGGYVESGLSDVAFMWMYEKAAACGLAFNDAWVDRHFDPQPLADAHESRKRFYRLSFPFYRPIGADNSCNEDLHPSVRERYRKQSNYRPRNLVSYLR